ncbi:hypothetical protein CPB85DRAFT_1305038 [Mucidula mucida]|nr:hypothetical protein CPB85DRAFT_1305038 [Mucidula mucida]
MSDLFEMDVDQPMHASPRTCHVESYPIQATRQRNLRRPTSMPILTYQSTDFNTIAHERLNDISSMNEEDHAMESDDRTYQKRFHKAKNVCFNQAKDGYQSDTDEHPRFCLRERNDAFTIPSEGAVTPRRDSLAYFDLGFPHPAIPPMPEDETPQRRKRARVSSGADQTSVTSLSGTTERRPMKKLRA